MGVDTLDVECTQAVENDATVSKGHADGLIEAMSKFVMEKIIEIKRVQRTEELKHKDELNKLRNTPPTGTIQPERNVTNTTNAPNKKIFKACSEVKPKSVMTYECQFSEVEYYVTVFWSYYAMSENTQNVLPGLQQALIQSLVDSTLWSKPKERIEETASLENCVKRIEDIFAEKFPILEASQRS